MSDDLKSQLTIKNVTLEDIDQFNALLRYVFQITDTELSESGYGSKKDLLKSKQPILNLSDVFGWYTKNNTLVSQIAIYPCLVNIHGKIFKMGGITGVGTYPEYAGIGLMKDLIHEALRKMKDNHQWISYLYPYSIPYYRSKGWEIMSDKLSFKVKDTQLPKHINLPGMVERKPIDHPDVLYVYEQFAKENHGALIRSDFHWEEYWRYEKEEDKQAAVYYNEKNSPTGVLFYWIQDDIFHIKEMFYLTQEARIGLWNFISAHFSMVYWVQGDNYKNEPLAFLLNDSQIKETIEPYYMARITHVKNFFRAFPFSQPGEDLYFEIFDPVAEWNNGIFSLHWNEKNDLFISNEKKGHKVKCNIQTLTCLAMNYRRPSYLNKIERLEASGDALAVLEKIFPDTEAYFSDYF